MQWRDHHGIQHSHTFADPAAAIDYDTAVKAGHVAREAPVRAAPVRAAVERANSHLQNWKILVTRFRPPLEKFPATLRAVVGSYYLKWAYE